MTGEDITKTLREVADRIDKGQLLECGELRMEQGIAQGMDPNAPWYHAFRPNGVKTITITGLTWYEADRDASAPSDEFVPHA